MFPRFESIGFVGIVVVYFHVSVRNVTSHKVLVNLTWTGSTNFKKFVSENKRYKKLSDNYFGA